MTTEEILQIFFAECEESLSAAEAGLSLCKMGAQDADTINAVFRAVHSIKGGAGAFGFVALQAYTHTLEALLSDVRDGSVGMSDALVDLLLRALDTLSDHVDAARHDGQQPDDAGLIAELVAAQTGGGIASVDALQTSWGSDLPTAAADNDEQGNALCFDDLLDDIMGAMTSDAEVASTPDAPTSWVVHVRPHAGAMCNGGEPLLLLRELERLGGRCIACESSAVPCLDSLDAVQGYLGWSFVLPAEVNETAVHEIFDFVADDWSIVVGRDGAMPPVLIAPADVSAPAPEGPKDATAASQEPMTADIPATADGGVPVTIAASGTVQGQSIRIELGKLDRLVDAVGELVIAQAMIAQRLEGTGIAASEELALLETLTRDIQESAMSIRAQPIGTVFNRVPRILRELAAATGKHVRLDVSGEATELDKTVVERLGEPLTHLIRNAVDHGIETVEQRLAAGKEPEGTLSLSAEHRSGRICIRISDDGQGIDRTRVLAKALEKGLIGPDAQLTPEEIDTLIFAPGFSTAATVTSVSGRGVGMDVVRQNVKELGGRITIESEQGKGTTMTLTLPLTLAIADGMIVVVGGETMVVPVAHVVECLKPEPGHLQGMGGHTLFNMRGHFIPVVPVSEVVGGDGTDAGDGVLIVVDTETSGRAALLVDGINDQRQFVIKSLATNYQPVDGIAGATILGDGRVALILDIDGLVTGTLRASERQAA
ncbi:MAG: chemotaxis protein CheA [Novosphingobium sp.]